MSQGIIQPPAYQRPSGKLYLGSEQINLVDMTETLVELDTIPAGYTDGVENVVTHRITPGVAGFYSIVGQVYFVGCIANKSYYSLIRLNAAGAWLCDRGVHTGGLVGHAVAAICILPNQYLSKTDFVSLWAQSNAGVDTVDITQTEPRTFLALQRVR